MFAFLIAEMSVFTETFGDDFRPNCLWPPGKFEKSDRSWIAVDDCGQL